MAWLKIKLQADEDHVEAIADMLEECGAVAVSIEEAVLANDFNSSPLLETEQDSASLAKLWRCSLISGLFPAETNATAVIAKLNRGLGTKPITTFETEQLADQDWERAWMENFHPLQIADSLWICPSWRNPPDPQATNILLDPGLAFGTGTHPSTALCLKWLAGQDLTGKTIIDYGCGSGIIAITALKLGADSAWGIDNDERALSVSEDNAVHNGIAAHFQTLTPALVADDLQADIVVANILAQTLIALAPHLTALVKPDGYLLLAGVLTQQLTEVSKHFEPHFTLTTVVRRESSAAATNPNMGTQKQQQMWGLIIGKKGADAQ